MLLSGAHQTTHHGIILWLLGLISVSDVLSVQPERDGAGGERKGARKRLSLYVKKKRKEATVSEPFFVVVVLGGGGGGVVQLNGIGKIWTKLQP